MRALRECPYVLHLRAVAFVGPAGAEEEAFMLLDLCRENLVSYLQVRCQGQVAGARAGAGGVLRECEQRVAACCGWVVVGWLVVGWGWWVLVKCSSVSS